jgi:hypothetical protein
MLWTITESHDRKGYQVWDSLGTIMDGNVSPSTTWNDALSTKQDACPRVSRRTQQESPRKYKHEQGHVRIATTKPRETSTATAIFLE